MGDSEDDYLSFEPQPRGFHILEETRTMRSFHCDVMERIDGNDSKYSRRLKSKRKEQLKRTRRAEKKRERRSGGKARKYRVAMVLDRNHSALADKGCNVVYRY